MDWDLYERYRATVFLAVIAFVSFLLLVLQHTAGIRHLRTLLVISTLPTERYLAELREPPPVRLPAEGSGSGPASAPPTMTENVPSWGAGAEERRAATILRQENTRLRELLELKQRRWPRAVAAHVVGRDPQRWFQEIVLDKGRAEGLAVDDPVVAIAEGREGLVGRITEANERVSKVMLVQDPLSAVAATVMGATAEDGVVEGGNGHELILKYLDRGSKVRIGDAVMTSGLGKAFPDGVPIGWVQDIGLDTRQLFLQARLRPAVLTNQLHVVLVLTRAAEAQP